MNPSSSPAAPGSSSTTVTRWPAVDERRASRRTRESYSTDLWSNIATRICDQRTVGEPDSAIGLPASATLAIAMAQAREDHRGGSRPTPSFPERRRSNPPRPPDPGPRADPPDAARDLLPLGLLVALAVFLDSPGPVIYRSQRIGKGGLVFEMLKFRTMERDAEGPPLSAAGDERYTPLGRRLALSRLDELPQIWNVLKGDMRLVGPRPEVEGFVAAYAGEYERILSVPPGLTGPAQVEYAWEGEVLAKAQAVDRARVYRESIQPYKLAIDLAYVKHHGVLGDLALLARTLRPAAASDRGPDGGGPAGPQLRGAPRARRRPGRPAVRLHGDLRPRGRRARSETASAPPRHVAPGEAQPAATASASSSST